MTKQDKYQKYYDAVNLEDKRLYEANGSSFCTAPNLVEAKNLLDDAERVLDVAKLYEEKCQDFYGQTHQRLIRFFEQLMKEVSKYG